MLRKLFDKLFGVEEKLRRLDVIIEVNRKRSTELKQAIKDANESVKDNKLIMLKAVDAINETRNKYIELAEEYKKALELQKMYSYIIPKLINSAGIDIPENFDITNYDDAEKLYNRYRKGDLMDR